MLILSEPDFEPEFYADQIKMMEERYSKIFKKWKMPWRSYYKEIKIALRKNQYWIWVYLCGFEKFIKENQESEVTKTMLDKDSDARIKRIVGDQFRIKNYIDSL